MNNRNIQISNTGNQQPQDEEMQKINTDMPMKNDYSCTRLIISFFFFIVEFILDLLVVFPLYFFKMIFESFRNIKQQYSEDEPKDCKKYLKLACAYFLDIILPFSIVGITIITIQDKIIGTDDIYYDWCENCLYFFICFTLLTSFVHNLNYQTQFECSFNQNTYFSPYLQTTKHIFDESETLGLGIIHQTLLRQMKIKGQIVRHPSFRMYQENQFCQSFVDFSERIENLSKQQNIDLSLFYFDLLDNRISSSITQRISQEDIEKLQTLKKSGISAKISAKDKILWSIYEKSTFIIQQELYPLGLMVLILCFKIMLPLWYLFDMTTLRIDQISIICTSGFYVYMVLVVYKRINNQDLRHRNYIVSQVNKLIDFKDADETSFVLNLDVTCPVSLESWNNSRHIICQLDHQNTRKIELIYIFLGFYYVFICLIYQSIYFETYYFIDEEQSYLHPFMILHTTIDFLIITIFFCIRKWNGYKFNENFSQSLAHVNELITIYDKFIERYDIFFKEKLKSDSLPLQNKMVSKIITQSQVYISGKKEFRGKIYQSGEEKTLQIQIMKINKEILEKAKIEISKDEKQFRHKMFLLC